jgi:hypothetical protein
VAKDQREGEHGIDAVAIAAREIVAAHVRAAARALFWAGGLPGKHEGIVNKLLSR